MKKYLLLFSILFLMAVPLGCEKAPSPDQPADNGTTETGRTLPEGATSKPGDPYGMTGEAESINLANVVLKPDTPEAVTLTVEVARTPEERRRGLQGRERLAEDHGMWFVFEEDVRDPFWMRNTSIPLDIIFIDRGYHIVDIIENTVPNSEVLLVPDADYRYALELNAGDRYGLRAGDEVEFRLGPR